MYLSRSLYSELVDFMKFRFTAKTSPDSKSNYSIGTASVGNAEQFAVFYPS